MTYLPHERIIAGLRSDLALTKARAEQAEAACQQLRASHAHAQAAARRLRDALVMAVSGLAGLEGHPETPCPGCAPLRDALADTVEFAS